MLSMISKFFAFADQQRGKWYKGIFFAVLHSVFEALQLLGIAVALRAIVEANMSTQTVWLTLGLMLVSVVGMMVTRHISDQSEIVGSYKMCEEKRTQIGDRMKYMPMGYFTSHSLGKITAAATTTMEEIEKIAPPALSKTILGLVRTLIITIGLMFFDWRIGLMVLGGAAVFFLINEILQRKSLLLSPLRQKAQARVVETVLEYIQGMTVVRAFKLDQDANKAMNRAIAEVEKKNFELEFSFTPYVAAQQLSLRLTSAAIIAVAIGFYLSGTMELFRSLLMVVSGFFVYSGLEASGLMSAFLRLVNASIDRVEAISQTPVMDIDGTVHQPENYDIAVENISFAYENRKIIDDVSFTIPANTTTAIVGPSGGGKTTLCNLIARFWDVDEGRITLGGRDVREYTLDSLLANISMVFQRVYLFNDTIANNIKFGKPDATMEEMVEAAKRACCHDFITALPDGYDTLLGEGGATISGGEKQRISIARAMLKDAPIIILDEATANVDPENELELQTAIAALTEDKTVIMIAHRLKTVRHADQILVVDRGKIVQRGTHDELVEQKGIYADFIGIRKKAIGWKIGGSIDDDAARQVSEKAAL